MENEKLYTVVLYTPSCRRDYYVDGFDSEFEMFNDKTEEEAIELISQYTAQAYMDMAVHPQYELFEGDPVDTELLGLDPKIKLRSEQLVAEKKAHREVMQQRKKDLEAKREEALRRAQYERLKAEFEKEES